jgi:hypothetical protein
MSAIATKKWDLFLIVSAGSYHIDSVSVERERIEWRKFRGLVMAAPV